MDAHGGLAVADFFTPHGVGFDHVHGRIAEQVDFEFELGNKVLMALRIVSTDAKDDGIEGLQILKGFGELAGFKGAAGGVIFGIKINHKPFARKIAKGNGGVILVWKAEIRGRVAKGKGHEVYLLRFVLPVGLETLYTGV